MICRCFGHTLDLAALGKRVEHAAHVMVGLPDYENYVAHMRERHPDQPPMAQGAFFRERQAARYGGGKAGFRCC